MFERQEFAVEIRFETPADAPGFVDYHSLGKHLAKTRGVYLHFRGGFVCDNHQAAPRTVPASITLYPVTTKGELQQCWIELPADVMEQLCRQYLAQVSALEAGDERIAAYLAEGGVRCPGCGSDDLVADQVASDVNGCYQTETVCHGCGSDWNDVYELVRVAGVRMSTPPPAEQEGA